MRIHQIRVMWEGQGWMQTADQPVLWINHRTGFDAVAILLLKLKDQFHNGPLILLNMKSDVTEKTLISIWNTKVIFTVVLCILYVLCLNFCAWRVCITATKLLPECRLHNHGKDGAALCGMSTENYGVKRSNTSFRMNVFHEVVYSTSLKTV